MQFTDAPLQPFGETLLEIALPTQLSFKTALVFRLVNELKQRNYLPWTGSHRAELCFDEGLGNAMVHGNKLNAALKVRVALFGDDARWGIIIEDEGDGFGVEDVPNPDAPDFIFRESGHGIMLMESYVDELRYNRKGNRLYMVRRRQTEPDAGDAAAAVQAEVAETPLRVGAPVVSTMEGDIEIVEVLATRITDENADAIREATAISPGKSVILDMSRVEYIASVGLSAIVGLYKALKAQKGEFVLVSVQSAVRDILKSAHLAQLLRILPDRAAAIAELKKTS